MLSAAVFWRRIVVLTLIALIVVLVCVTIARAMPPSPTLLARAKHDKALAARLAAFEKHARAKGIDAPRLQRTSLGQALGVPGAPVSPGLQPQLAAPASGTLRTLALVVDFSDVPATVPASGFDSLLFADTYGPVSVRGYYREVSYGSPSVPGMLDVVTLDAPSSSGWLRMPQAQAYYVGKPGEHGTGGYPNNCQKMVEDAVAAADSLVDFSKYDNDGDGYVDNLLVIHAGRGAELTGSNSDIWSHQWWTKQPVAVDGVQVSDYSTEPEYWQSPGDMTSGVFCHEMGHVLGLPDLYDRDGSSAGIGEWSLMAGGSWNGYLGSSPARLDAWSASQLGWLQPQLIAGSPAARSIAAVASSPTGTAYKLYPDGAAGGSEYFLIENRRRTGTDAGLPGDGLLVWHVDETRSGFAYWNDDEAHKLVDLEEAAGYQSLDAYDDRGTADDPYPGTTGNRAFTDSSAPDAHTYAGAASRVVIDQISDSATTMSARLGVGSSLQEDTVPPVTTATGYDDLWHAADVTVTFSAIDGGAAASGVAYTAYRVDGGGWSQGTSCTIVAMPAVQRTYTIGYYSVDKAGNAEPEKTCQVKIDTRVVTSDETPPTVTISGAGNGGWYRVDTGLTITAADEPGGSGVASISYTLDGLAGGASRFAAFVAVPATPNRVHLLTYRATDNAGNTSAEKTFTMTTDTAGPLGQGRNVAGRRATLIPLRYRFADNLSPLVWNVKVTVKNRAGRTVKTFKLGSSVSRQTATTYAVKWRPRLRGRYRYSVTCRDSAGNVQTRKATGTVTVR